MAASALLETELVTDQAINSEEAAQTTDFQLIDRDKTTVEAGNYDQLADDGSAVYDHKQDTDTVKFDIVCVHGLHGSKETWATSPTPDSPSQTWLDKLFSGIAPEGGRLIAYDYSSDEESMEYYTPQGIYQKAHKLLEELVQRRTPDIKNTGRPIYFACHDIGGLIVKAAIVLASSSESIYADILPSIRVFIFFGYPHRSFTNGDLEERVFWLLSLQNDRYHQGHATRLAQVLSETINEVNSAFIHTNILNQARMINIFSTHEDPTKRIFDRFTATMGTSFEYQLPSVKSHLGIVDIEELDSYTKGISPNKDWLNFPENITTGLRRLINQASPKYPALNDNAVKENPELECLTKADCNRILHIQCTSNASVTSENVRSYYYARTDSKTKLLYFCFNSHDIRFNTINAMLWTFCAQIAYNYPKSLNSNIKNGFPNIHNEHPQEFASLLSAWECIGFRDRYAADLYILGCLDECDDSALRFLAQIQTIIANTEGRPKIVIITTKGTTKDKLITGMLSNFPSENISRIDYDPPCLMPTFIKFEMSMLFQGDHRYTAVSLQADVENIISGCAHDEALCRLLIKWLRSNQNSVESLSQTLIKLRLPSPELIFETVLTDIPEQHYLWAQKLFSWMLSSFRPLRTLEFCRVSNLCMSNARDKSLIYTNGSNTRNQLANILRRLGGLLVVVHDEIHFSHTSIYGWLKSLVSPQDKPSSTKEWYRQMTERDRHITIVQTCLEHLQDEADMKPVWTVQLPYATQFWAAHYKQSGLAENVAETVFRYQPLLKRWVDAYMALPTPFLKPLQKSRKPLPIAAHFGLEDLVKSFVTANIENDAESLGQGLVEATRAAQLPTLRLIIQFYPGGLNLEDIYVQDALLAAAYCENHEVYREIVNHIRVSESHMITQQQRKWKDEKISSSGRESMSDSLSVEHSNNYVSIDEIFTNPKMVLPKPYNSSSWLSEALWQTSRLGMDDVITKLLSFGGGAISTLTQTTIEPLNLTPLFIASRYSHLRTARLLIAAGASLTTEPKFTWGTPLHQAIASGSSDITNLLLEEGAPIDAKDGYGDTPLHSACRLGNFVAARSLLQHQNFYEYIGPDSPVQPLLLAVSNGHYKTTETLLRCGADPNVLGGQNGESALRIAARMNRVNICRLLLAHKADPNAVSEKFLSPLITSVMEGNLDIVKLLVENGADMNQKEGPGFGQQRTPLHLAIIWEHSEIAQYLLSQNADPDLPDENGRTPLWVAAELRDLKVVRMLVAAKVDIHSFDNQKKWTALHAAYDSPETVHILLEQGADINRLSEQGNTPLDLAIWNNFPKVIETMLKESKNKPDLSLTSTHVALWSAVDRGYSEVVSLMLEAGADVNFIDEDNMPLASTAMWLSDDVMIRTILEYCPDLSMKDNNGDTALHYIGNKTPDTSVRLVVNAGGKLDTFNNDKATPLICAIRKQNMDAFTYLLTKKLVVDTLNITAFKDAGTPLHIACEMGTLEMVKSLIKNGSDINFTCTSWYGTPLIAATFRIRRFRDEMGAQIIKLLLDEGADPSLSAGLFGYPIIAASLSWPTHVVQWFLDRKASIDVKDAFGRKPAHSACYNSLKVLNALQVPDADFAVKDLVGRVPLHYAVLSGQLDLVEEVLARSERVGVGIDVRDNDGWTPLLWAARASRVLLSDEKEASAHVAVVSFLLDKKADPTIHGSGLFRDWTASEVAYYHNADSIADLITARNPLRKRASEPKKRGKLSESPCCDCCHLEMSGVFYKNLDLYQVNLCFKCYRSKSLIWPQHKFKELGYEWDSDDSASEVAQSEADKPTSEKNTVNEEENIDNQFDDEIVDEDDLKEQEMEMLQERNN